MKKAEKHEIIVLDQGIRPESHETEGWTCCWTFFVFFMIE